MTRHRKNPAAVALGRKGGKSRSAAKIAAGRANAARAQAALAAKRAAAKAAQQ